MDIQLNYSKAVTAQAVAAYKERSMQAQETLHLGNGKGNDFLGWLHLPSEITTEHLQDIQETANLLRAKCDVIVTIGIGGSYSVLKP